MIDEVSVATTAVLGPAVNTKALDPRHAEELKTHLRSRAHILGLDLSDPQYRYTLWIADERQHYVCEFNSLVLDDMHPHIGPLLMRGGVLLEVNGTEDKVTLFMRFTG